MYKCPLCGKTANRRGNTFDRVDRVVGHIDGSHDGRHDGARGEEFIAEIEEVEPSETDDDGLNTDSDPTDIDGPDAPPDAGGDALAVATPTTGDGEETQTEEVPEFEQESPEEEEEELVLMPENELEEMRGETDREQSETRESTGAEESSTAETTGTGSSDSEGSDSEMGNLVETDPVEVAEKAQESGWSAGAIVAWLLVIMVGTVVWHTAQDLAEQKREQVQNTWGPDPAVAGGM